MASSSQIREWWAPWECNTAKFRKAAFPGDGKTWSLSIADQSAPVWEAVIDIMETTPYLFLESAGGTYNCRPISGSSSMSIHAYALALDLNPAKNPYGTPLRHNYPADFIRRMEGIRANGKQAITWGGRWSTPDAMHWQINVAPGDCKNVTWERRDEMEGPNGEPNWEEVSDWAQKAWTQAHKAGILTEDSHPRDDLEVEQMMVYLDRAKVI